MPHRRKGSTKLYIRVQGVRQSAGTDSYEDAKALEDRLNHQVWLERKMGLKPPKSWKEAVVRWCHEKSSKVTLNEDIRKFNWLDPHLGSCQDLNQITRDRVDAIMQLRGVSGPASKVNSTANRYVALISGVINAAEREWEWGNRAAKLRTYQEPPAGSASRALTLGEWWKLALELPNHLKLPATFSLSSGLREAKVFGLRWADLDIQGRCLSFSGTGNKLGNLIPLNATALQVLEECRSLSVVSPEYVFLYNGRPMKEHGQAAWQKAVKRAGIGPVRWHDLRVTFNSWLAQNGVPEQIQKRLIGHAVSGVHDRYSKLAIEHLRPFAEIIDKVLGDSNERVRETARGT
jgi:integrase